MGAPVVDINIVKGKTFEFMYRYADQELAYLPISGMPSTAPVRLTVVNHGIPDGWPISIEGVKQPEELNTGDGDVYIASVVTSSVIELNSVRSDNWRAYIPSGSVIFNRPFDLTGCSARMQIRDRVDGKILLTLNSDSSTEPDGIIEIDTSLAALVVRLTPAVTTAITWRQGVYDLELITPSGDVYPVTAISKVRIGDEVTR
ncbi:hypothetical protein ACI2KS_10385 [Pseudomonas sp. NPDC087358]|uniref:hypothetical protein n=1 Tax=Pseudomonas sp. NPDC087358 TaxID=3364439 RepID=UPI00384DC7DE